MKVMQRPAMPRMRLKIMVPLLPSHSVKKIAEKMPMTDPRMMELLSRVT
jgi:hypothetical protein